MEQMDENEQKKVAIEKYTSIQRIKKHGQEEIEYQEKIAKPNYRYSEYRRGIWNWSRTKGMMSRL